MFADFVSMQVVAIDQFAASRKGVDVLLLKEYIHSQCFQFSYGFQQGDGIPGKAGDIGSLIYYSYGEKEIVNAQSRSLAGAVEEISDYDLADSNGIDGAEYKDWAIDELEIPSLTVEIGCEDAALEEREIYSIFTRNDRVLPAIARWLQMQE